MEIRHTGVVKIDRTRDAVAQLILEGGPQTASDLAARLGLSPAGVRRHLDALVADGRLTEYESKRPVQRGRGRPARMYAVTPAGRSAFPHAYDELATTALRYLRSVDGDAGVHAFAEQRARALEAELAASLPALETDAAGPVGTAGPGGAPGPTRERAQALAMALTEHGYAAGVEATIATGGTGATAVGGVQICQHHCPVADVAHEFPELCEAETRAFGRLLGTHVQRLATIGHGEGVCTTHIPLAADPQLPQRALPDQPVPTGSRK
jgi:predicted ArsR family transcriptional regulator